jgi:hypothetical protein
MDAELPYIEAKGTYREVGRQIGEAERELVPWASPASTTT